MPTVLVTGAGGFTGLALARTLVDRGYTVRGLVRSATSQGELAATGAEVVCGDVREGSLVRRAVEGVDVIYHLAAVFRRAGVPDSEYRSVHVDATRELIEAAARSGVRRVVHCSTVGVHGHVRGDAPATEDAPFHPMAGARPREHSSHRAPHIDVERDRHPEIFPNGDRTPRLPPRRLRG